MNELCEYMGYTILPSLRMIEEGAPFAGTWVIEHCAIGRRNRSGYEVRYLLGDSTHFTARESALSAAFDCAVRTIDLREVGSRLLAHAPREAGARK